LIDRNDPDRHVARKRIEIALASTTVAGRVSAPSPC